MALPRGQARLVRVRGAEGNLGIYISSSPTIQLEVTFLSQDTLRHYIYIIITIIITIIKIIITMIEEMGSY